MKLGYLRVALLGTLGFLMFPYSNFGQANLTDMHHNGLEGMLDGGNEMKTVALGEAATGNDLLNSRRKETIHLNVENPQHSKATNGSSNGSRLSLSWFEPLERPVIIMLKNAGQEVGIESHPDLIRDVDYFKDFVKFYLNKKEFSRNGYTGSSAGLIATKQALEESYAQNGQAGLVLAINGGHVLSNSVYLENGLTSTSGYEELVMQNVLRVKGEKPLIDNTREILRHPVFALALASRFENGLCGSEFGMEELSSLLPKNIRKQIASNEGFTALGYKVINELLSLDQGNRVLIDINGMSLQSRKDYYEWLKASKLSGSAIPILASSSGISGLDWMDPDYSEKRTKGKYQILSHKSSNLSKNDIIKIYQSKGLIGVSLDRKKIFASDLLESLVLAERNPRQELGLYVRGFLANVFTIIQSVGEKQAWDIVSIGSGFNVFEGTDRLFENQEEFHAFRNALKNYLENPESIPGLFTKEELQSLMFGLSAEEITEKIFARNGYEFLKTHLPEEQLATKFDIFSTNRP